ncbi:universal stress protein [Halobellus marinus]|jgi:nucleotide-binding universal stress UspA family protein|uniref:universal stress protein n=1 Tax=Halobellus TaxID=1073986 RepID=UPI0028B0F9E2|nr:universal stress protein [Halobellus sp. DFY28]
MYRILLAVDENEDRAHYQADYIAERPGTESVEVCIIHAWSGDLESVPEESVGTQTVDHVGSVQAAVERFEEAGIDYDVIDGAGDPGELVLDVAEDVNPSEIVMSRGKRSPVGKALFGSVTQKVLLNTDAPVVVINPGED